MSSVLVVGVAGGTGAGKTTLCRLLARQLGQASILDLDSYYLDRSALSPKSRTRLNFDEPAAFEVSLLLQHLQQLRGGGPIEKPRYSFQHQVRLGFDTVDPAPVLLVEGLFTLWWEELRPIFDVKVFVDALEDIRLARRLSRDAESRGRTAESVLQQYETTVRPMHDRYVEPTRTLAGLVVVNNRDLTAGVTAVCAALQAAEAAARRRPEHHVPRT